jgi:UDP-hydrolysing UDP-N-acetyl-D-glucosamine 2-epimerase
MRTVGVVTVARSDYGIYRPVLRALERRDDTDIQLYVGGMHLAERFGLTVSEIEDDGFPIVERVDFLGTGDSAADVAGAIGRGVVAFAEAFARSRPEVLVLVGDRFEMLAAGIAALPLTIPLAHIHGGESTEGAIDEAIRHALTKLSHLHFAAADVYARRIVQMGEEPWRVHVTGAPALDGLVGFEPLSDAALAAHGVRLRGPTLLVTYHPVTLAPEQTGAELDAVLEAVAESGLDAVFTFPNADAGHGRIVTRLESLRGTNGRFTLVPNLGTDAYLTMMSRAAAMVGNSSSGIVEAASFRLPVVDVGIRQRGRVRPPNVIGAGGDAGSIRAAIERAVDPAFRRSLDDLVNPYGDGHAGERIAEVLATIPLDERLLVKRFHDLRGDAGRLGESGAVEP